LRSDYVRELADFYNAVDQLQEDLLKMAKTARTPELRPGLEQYLDQMRELGHRIERIFSMINEKSLKVTCNSMKEIGEEFHENVDRARCADHSLRERHGNDPRSGPYAHYSSNG